MSLLDLIVEEAQKNHSEEVVYCKNCCSTWTFIVPHSLVITDNTTEEDKKMFDKLHRKVCPRGGNIISDLNTIKYKMDLTKDYEEVCDRPWVIETT